METNNVKKKMKQIYHAPVAIIIKAEYENRLCAASTDKASIGTSGSTNEVIQDDIVTGGPGISGAKKVGYSSAWED